MVFTKAYVLPILFGFWLPVTIFITYTVSVLTDHVPLVLPYISDTGSWAPESCIFGILLTLGALIMFTIMYIRYKQVEYLQEKNEFSKIFNRLNYWSFYVGVISVFGGLIVANFQVGLIFFVHIMGAGICFGFGTLYQILQVIIAFKLYPIIGKKSINICRIFLTAVSTISLTVTCISGLVAYAKFRGEDVTNWGPEDGGYEFHFVSAVGEYVLTISTVFNIMSLAEEFKNVEMHPPKINMTT